MKALATIVTATVALGTAGVAQADLIVDWGGDYVTANQGLQVGSTINTVLSPAANYSGTSSLFYGDVTEDNANLNFVGNSGTTDFIRVRKGNTSNNGDALYLFHDEDFLVPQTDLSGADSSVLIDFTTAGVKYSDPRFVIENSSGYFISNTISDNVVTPINTLVFQVYTPGLMIKSPASASFGAVATPDLTDVSQVGFLAYIDVFTSGAENFDTFNFEVNAGVIPEPASLALLGLGGLCMLGGRRRRA